MRILLSRFGLHKISSPFNTVFCKKRNIFLKNLNLNWDRKKAMSGTMVERHNRIGNKENNNRKDRIICQIEKV